MVIKRQYVSGKAHLELPVQVNLDFVLDKLVISGMQHPSLCNLRSPTRT